MCSPGSSHLCCDSRRRDIEHGAADHHSLDDLRHASAVSRGRRCPLSSGGPLDVVRPAVDQQGPPDLGRARQLRRREARRGVRRCVRRARGGHHRGLLAAVALAGDLRVRGRAGRRNAI